MRRLGPSPVVVNSFSGVSWMSSENQLAMLGVGRVGGRAPARVRQTNLNTERKRDLASVASRVCHLKCHMLQVYKSNT